MNQKNLHIEIYNKLLELSKEGKIVNEIPWFPFKIKINNAQIDVIAEIQNGRYLIYNSILINFKEDILQYLYNIINNNNDNILTSIDRDTVDYKITVNNKPVDFKNTKGFSGYTGVYKP